LASTTWALFSLGTVLAIAAVALLLWPVRRREIVYVVTPTQLPEIAERLGVPLDSRFDSYLDDGPEPVWSAFETSPRPTVVPDSGAADAELPAWAGPTPIPSARASVSMGNQSSGPAIPAIFADPARRPNSLRTAMLLNPVNAGPHASTAPLRTNERGIYRSFGTPPQVKPSFLWTPVADAADCDPVPAEPDFAGGPAGSRA
jgi:hypothetical protein